MSLDDTPQVFEADNVFVFEVDKNDLSEVLIQKRGFLFGKRALDLVFGILLLPVFAIACLGLVALNPFLNPGPLFFRQERMGRNCNPFFAIKFRSMRPVPQIQRGVDDPLEHDRITPLGRIIRKMRVDELPQILNVFMGQMSLIGPRPDYFEHAQSFLRTVAGYRERHIVRPGISGLAQTEIGYVEGTEATRAKVKADLEYIRNLSVGQELRILWNTVRVVARGAGS